MKLTRFAKQVQVLQHIVSLDKDEDVGRFFRLLVEQLRHNDKKSTNAKFLTDIFMSVKSRLDEKSLDRLLQSCRDRQADIESKDDENDEYDAKKAVKSATTTTALESNNLRNLPPCIFNSIGSYLNIESSINLSKCNRLLHQLVNNYEYFDECTENKVLILNEDKIGLIVQTGCQFSFFNSNNCHELQLHTKTATASVDCIYSRKLNLYAPGCALSKLNEMIENGTHTPNPDLLWLKNLLGRVVGVFVSNDWQCAFDHSPLKFLLTRKDSKVKDVELIGATENDLISVRLAGGLCKCYTKYMSNLCEENRCKLRKVKRVWFEDSGVDLHDFFSHFGGNVTSIMVALPRSRATHLLNNLDEFFDIYHRNLKGIEIDVKYVKKADFDIASQFFDNADLVADLNKPETDLSFSDFLQKYACQSITLPQVENLWVYFTNHVDALTVFKKFLLHDKITRLFNIFESVTQLTVLSYSGRVNVGRRTKEVIVECLKHLKALSTICLVVASTDEQHVQKFHGQYGNDVLIDCATISPNLKEMQVQWGNDDYGPNLFETQIQISNKTDLLCQNRDALRALIAEKTKLAMQNMRTSGVWDVNTDEPDKYGIVERFHFSRAYLV